MRGKSLYRINSVKPATNKTNVLVTMDVHGVIFETTWFDELKAIYCKVTGDINEKNIRNWQELNMSFNSRDERIDWLTKKSEKSRKEIESIFHQIQKELHDERIPRLKPKIKEFLKALQFANIEVILLSGSGKELLIKQLKMTGVLQYFNENKIYGLNTSFFIKNDVKTLFLQKLVNSNLNKIIFHFDDWVVGLDVIKNNGGIIFGVPIGDGKIFQMNKKVMLDYGIKNIIKDWSCWRDIISIIKSRNIV